jgi:general secretion pathway protein D
LGHRLRHLFLECLFRKLLILLGLACVCQAPCQGNDTANQLFRDGQRAEHLGDRVHAYVLYARAAALDPANSKILARKDALAALLAGAAETSLDADPEADADIDARLAEDDTGGAQVSEEFLPGEIERDIESLPPARLQAPPGTKHFELRGTGQVVAEQVARAYGIQLVFDRDYQDTPAFNFHTGEMTMAEALRTLEAMTNSIIVPLNENLALVVRDTAQRRSDTSAVMFTSIPIPERISVQDAQEMVTAVQQTLQIKTISMDPGRHMVFLRDSVGKVIAARQIFADLSRLRAQVEVDVELISVTKDSALGIGLTLPNSTTLVNFGNFLQNAVSPGGMTNFLTFGGGKTLFGLGVASAQAFATLARSSTDTTFSSQVQTLDGQPVTLHVGERYPIITNTYVGSTAGTTGQVFQPPPTVNFEDLGLALKLTPSVHAGGEMTLDIDAAYTVLGNLNGQGIPTISQRKYVGKVRLNSDEWAVIAGLTQESDTHSISGIPGLSNIPAVGRIFRNDNYSTDHTETLIVLKPRLVNLPPWETPTHAVWVGTESKPIDSY